jgi:hypothetical protein
MAEIKLFLLSSMNENEHSINQFFPLDFHDEASSSEVLKIKKIFKKCGDGCLQTKDYKYFYKTFIPLMNSEQNLFLIFYCTNSYSEKNIDKLCEEIFQILDDEPIEDMKLKNSAKLEINQAFLKYRYLDKDIKDLNVSIFGRESKASKKISISENIDDRSDLSSLKGYGYSNKRGDPRFYSYINQKQSMDNDSDIFSDSNVFKTISFEDSGLNNTKKYNVNITNENFENWKKMKKNYLIFSLILCLFTYFVFPLLIRLIFN